MQEYMKVENMDVLVSAYLIDWNLFEKPLARKSNKK